MQLEEVILDGIAPTDKQTYNQEPLTESFQNPFLKTTLIGSSLDTIIVQFTRSMVAQWI